MLHDKNIHIFTVTTSALQHQLKKWNLPTLRIPSWPLPICLSKGNTILTSTYWLVFACFCTLCKQSLVMNASVSDFFGSTLYLWNSSMLCILCQSQCSITFHWMTMHQFRCPFNCSHLSCFQFEAKANSAVMNIFVKFLLGHVYIYAGEPILGAIK